LLRWGVIGTIIYFVFVINPSRTAQLALIAVIVSGLLMWNWRSGFFIAVIVITCIIAVAMSNKTFVKKWQATYRGINDVVTKDADEIGRAHKDRHWILVKLIPEIKKKPLAGYGLDVEDKIVRRFLPYNSSDGFAHTHCEFTQITIQFGLVGLGIFILFLLSTFLYSEVAVLPINRFIFCVMLVVIIDMFFNVPLYFCRQKFVTLFTIAIAVSEISYYIQIRKIRNQRKEKYECKKLK
jgi:O-antigen ligase